MEPFRRYAASRAETVPVERDEVMIQGGFYLGGRLCWMADTVPTLGAGLELGREGISIRRL